jgi:hypothetical protein
MKYEDLFVSFVQSKNTFMAFKRGRLIFTSQEERLFPVLNFISSNGSEQPWLTFFDKIAGNAAALLAVKAGCRRLYSPLGSENAVKTLEKAHIRYRIDYLVPFIQTPSGEMCPMEKLSLGKSPEEFYQLLTRGR